MSVRFPARRRAALAALALSIAACGDPVAAPPSADPSLAATKFWEVGSSVAWNRTAQELMPAASNPAMQARLFTYLSIAQYNAVVAAERSRDRGVHPSPAAAAAGASLVVLKSFLPGALHATLDARLQAQLSGGQWPGERHTDLAAGEAIGRSIGAEVVAYAETDGFNTVPAPANPGGAGSWTGSNPFRGLYGARLLVLETADQFRSPPPPAFGSPEFAAALAEVRDVTSDLPEALRQIALTWNPRSSKYMNELATGMLVEHRRKERDAARILALANLAGFDVVNACFDAKFAYYYIRPTQADAAVKIAAPLGLPNHPSYPSGHSCITTAFATVLADAFPSERGRLEAMVEEAGLSRMYAGFHYRFDLDAGQELGRQVARWVLQHGIDGRGPIALD